MNYSGVGKDSPGRFALFGFLDVDIQQINFNSALIPFAGSIIVVLFAWVIYSSRTRFGFYLRKTFPVTFLRRDVSNYKTAAHVLFVDDQDVQIAETLKDEGWQITKARDAKVDDQKVKDANVIFVDWRGVGRRINAEEEGISLVENLKRKYGHRKYIILYSAQEFTKPSDIVADDWISKGSDSALYLQTLHRASFALFG